MFYFESKMFYLDLKKFLSSEFKMIRSLYFFSYLSKDCELNIKKEMKAYFCDNFVLFLDRAMKHYSLTKLLAALHKLYKKFEKKYDNKLLVFSNKELDAKNKELISSKLFSLFHSKFKIEFVLDDRIIAGLIIIYNHISYDLSMNYVLSNVRKKVMQNIIKGVLK